MGTLEEELQKLHDSKIGVWISWLWDGGVDVRLRNGRGAALDEGNVQTIADVLPWLERAIKQHIPKSAYVRGYQTAAGALHAETPENLRLRNQHRNLVGGGRPDSPEARHEFYGFSEGSTVSSMAAVLPWLQGAIHHHHPESKYDVERRGGTWKPTWFGAKDYTVDRKPIREDGFTK